MSSGSSSFGPRDRTQSSLVLKEVFCAARRHADSRLQHKQQTARVNKPLTTPDTTYKPNNCIQVDWQLLKTFSFILFTEMTAHLSRNNMCFTEMTGASESSPISADNWINKVFLKVISHRMGLAIDILFV